MRVIFLPTIIAIVSVFMVSNIAYHFLAEYEMVATIIIIATTLNSSFTATFMIAFVSIATIVVLKETKLPFLRVFLTFVVEANSIVLMLYTLPVWWQSAGLGLVGIGLVALVCFWPRPGFLYPAQPPLPKEKA